MNMHHYATKSTPEQKKASAESEIRSYDSQIRYHDAEATRLRKVRQKHKAALARADAAIEREAAAAAYSARAKK